MLASVNTPSIVSANQYLWFLVSLANLAVEVGQGKQVGQGIFMASSPFNIVVTNICIGSLNTYPGYWFISSNMYNILGETNTLNLHLNLLLIYVIEGLFISG